MLVPHAQQSCKSNVFIYTTHTEYNNIMTLFLTLFCATSASLDLILMTGWVFGGDYSASFD